MAPADSTVVKQFYSCMLMTNSKTSLVFRTFVSKHLPVACLTTLGVRKRLVLRIDILIIKGKTREGCPRVRVCRKMFGILYNGFLFGMNVAKNNLTIRAHGKNLCYELFLNSAKR